MSERSAFIRMRDCAALGAVVAGFAGSGQALRPAEAITLRTQAIPELSSQEPGIRFVDGGEFLIGPESLNIDIQQGINTKGTPYSTTNIKAAVESVLRLRQEAPAIDFRFNYGNYGLELPLEVDNPKAAKHTFVIVRDIATIARISSEYRTKETLPNSPPAVTLQGAKQNITFLSIIEKGYQNRFDPRINTEDLALQIETCNNFLGLKFNDKSEAFINTSQKIPKSKKSELGRVSYEAVCNGYGVAVASKHSGLSYAEYEAIVEPEVLQPALSPGIVVPYPIFPESLFRQF